MKRLLIALGLVCAALPASATRQELDLQSEIRAGVRWLRSVQDGEGSYAGSVEATAWAVRAFGECPDRYRAQDGPFVRAALEYFARIQVEDGSISEEGVSDEARVERTRLAAASLALCGDERHTATLQRALAYLRGKGLEGPGWDEEPAFETPAQARSYAAELAGKRTPAGYWNGDDGRIVDTSRAIVGLSRAKRTLDAASSGSSEPAAIVPLPEFSATQREEVLGSMERGAQFLVAASNSGKWGAPGEPNAGITAMVLAALHALPEPRTENIQEAMDLGLAWLVSLQKPDGSIHDGMLANYTTSAAILALVGSGKSAYGGPIEKARKYLQTLQVDAGDNYSEGDLYYGGIGYGSTERPDLSNLQMALEALSASGLEKGDPTYTKALKFLERCQNRSESNDLRVVDGDLVVVSGDDGGAGYGPGMSKAGFIELGDGTRVPRSYGSMTYALLKCFVFAGLDRDDPRVQRAWEWCCANYTLDVNPGFVGTRDPTAAYQGLYYYFYTMARALEVFGEESVVDASGESHAWRSEMCGRLVSMQSPIDGSWINENSPRWWEGNPILATAYGLLTLGAAMPE